MAKYFRKIHRISIICMAFAGAALMLCGGNTVNGNQQAEETRMIETGGVIAEQQKITKEVVEIQEVFQTLASDKYGTELGALYAEYPQLSKLIVNREEYPDTLVEYLIGHKEAVDWVLEYPEYMKKSEAELSQTAQADIQPEAYENQGDIPIFYQWDKTWGYASYGEGCIAIEGCGPTALSMVASTLTGDMSLTPKKVADLSVENGYYTEELGTDWSLMSEGAALLGLQVTQPNFSKSALIAELSAGHPIICSMGPGDFTQKGHFIVLAAVDSEGQIVVNDPNSRINTETSWDADVLLSQIKGMWAYHI